MPASSVSSAAAAPVHSLAGSALRWERSGWPLLLLGGACVGIAALASIDRLRIGSSAFPLWIPFAMNAAIALVAGILLNQGVIRIGPPSPSQMVGYVLVPKDEWERSHATEMVDEVPAPARRAPRRVPIAHPASAPDLSAQLPLEVERLHAEARAKLGLGPTDPAELSLGPDLAPAPPPRPARTVPAWKEESLPVRPGPTSGPRVPEPARVTRTEYVDILHLGEALGVRRAADESPEAYTKRVLAAAEAPSGSPPGPPEPSRSSAAPAGPADSDRSIDDLLRELDEIAKDQPAPPSRKEPPKGTGRSA